jgi:hypothetical protein
MAGTQRNSATPPPGRCLLPRARGSLKGVFDAGFLFLHLGFGAGTYVDDSDAAGEFGQAFLELLAVVIRGGLLDLAANLGNTPLDVAALAVAFGRSWCFPSRSPRS